MELMLPSMPADDSLYTEVIRENLEKRILIINQEIDDDLIESYIAHIIKWNVEDAFLPIASRKKIRIMINSVGGDCFSGSNLIDVIEQSSTPVVGIGMGLVASMAFRIFIGCHERVAFKNSVLLQHDGSITISNSGSKAKDTMKFFEGMDKRVKDYTLSKTKMTEELYDKYYDTEFYMYADTTGRELGCVDKIIGEDVTLEEVFGD